MIGTASTTVTVAIDAVAWALLSCVVGFGLNRVPVERFAADSRLTRLRAFEDGGRLYDRRFRIRRWKDRVPEAGSSGVGFPKGRLAGRDRPTLCRFAAETRRAELVHWLLLACGPLFLVWNRGALAVAMVAYAAVANGPCILIQRYNRARLLRVLGSGTSSPRRARPSQGS
jgi:glycosyl-4,4'-diaponeurosporenoate acyltransferase